MMLTLEEQLSRALGDALRRTEAGDVPRPPEAARRGVEAPVGAAALRWEMPRDLSFGDLSSAIAFKLASSRQQAPPRVAQTLAGVLPGCVRALGLERWVDRVEPTGGFLNVFLSTDALAGVVRAVLRQGPRFGTRRAAAGDSVNLEFVSANPTGPLNVAHGRQAAVGDALARLLRAQGARVATEFYVNDEGRQIELLGESLRARYGQLLGRQEAFPEDGYHGAYLAGSATKLRQEHGDGLLDRPVQWFVEHGVAEQLAHIKADLARFGLRFDRWSSQRWLRTTGRIDRALRHLEARGALYESDGATWFASTRFGDDKDRVVRKRDGELTYLAPDIAYHQWKFSRGHTRLINLWGPDHHGYTQRLRAAVAAMGLPRERLAIRIVQLVSLSRRGKPVPMSKREGEFVTFREVLDEVGVDATRFFYLMRTIESRLDFDLELAKSQSQDNPVYYVQYAHARICSILAKAGLPFHQWWRRVRPDLGGLRAPEEQLLMRTLFQYPIVVRLCAEALEPHGLTAYLRRLAEAFHVFYTEHRVLGVAPGRSAARLALVRAVRQVLANGLGLLGVGAPRRM